MRDALVRIRKYWLPVGLGVVGLAVVWIAAVFGDLEGNVALLTLAVGGGILVASVAPSHPLRNGMLGGSCLVELAWATRAVSQAALGKVNVGEYGSWEMYWLTSLIALVTFAILGAVLGYVGGYVVRSSPRAASWMHPRWDRKSPRRE